MRPDVIRDTRKEIASVMEENNVVMNSQGLFSMNLPDSFMRENQKFAPPFFGMSL